MPALFALLLILFFVFLAHKRKKSATANTNNITSINSISRSPAHEPLKTVEEIVAETEGESQLVLGLPSLAPETMHGMPSKYHYKDVVIGVHWKYGGRYEESCESIGMKRGDSLKLVYKPLTQEDGIEDPNNISVYWHSIEIGHIRAPRMKSMILDWQADQLPIFCTVAYLGKIHPLYAEIAFYRPESSGPRSRKNSSS